MWLFLPLALLLAQFDLCAPPVHWGNVSPQRAACSTYTLSAAIKMSDFFYRNRIGQSVWNGIEPPHTPTITWFEPEEVYVAASVTPGLGFLMVNAASETSNINRNQSCFLPLFYFEVAHFIANTHFMYHPSVCEFPVRFKISRHEISA